MKHLHRAIRKRGAQEITADLHCSRVLEEKIQVVNHLIHSTQRSMRTMEGVPISTLDLVAAGSRIDLDGNAHRARALQGLEVEEFMIDLGEGCPQVKAPQATPRTPRKNGVGATKGATPPQMTPRTTRTERQDTRSPGKNIAKIKTYLFLGAAKRLMHSRGASETIQMIREGACPPMLKHMTEWVILITT